MMKAFPVRRLLVAVAAIAAAWIPAQAMALDPNTAVAGAGKAWFSGDLMSQPGLNCTIIGGNYSEIMVQGISSYGGLPGIPAVNQGYWTSFLVSVPGNPCGPGSSVVATDVRLPAGTTYDPSRQIRCFGQDRGANTFIELTGGRWNAFGDTGDYCPASPMASIVDPGAINLGYRPLASGQLFQVFVPVKSTQTLNGIAGSNFFKWYSSATGVYDSPGWSNAWATVLSSPTGGSPQFIESKSGAQAFWQANASQSPDTRSRIETWVNIYTNNLGGTLCFEIRRQSDNAPLVTCAQNASFGFDTAVAPNQPIIQLIPRSAQTTGPNGGFVPAGFSAAWWGTPVNLTWKFTPSSGPAITKTFPVTILSGPDGDGDGVADSADACPTVKGTLANGCLPTPQDDPDHDGVYGAADLCPTVDGRGAFNGCPGGVVPAPANTQQPNAVTTPTPSGTTSQGPVRGPASASLKGTIPLHVTLSGKGLLRATGTIPAAAAHKAGVPVVVAKGTATVKKAGGFNLALKPVRAARAKAAKLKGVVMTVRVRIPGHAPATLAIKLK